MDSNNLGAILEEPFKHPSLISQHMFKEEEQVFPLLVENMMAEFVPWLSASVSSDERQEMRGSICKVIPEEKLLQQSVIEIRLEESRQDVSDMKKQGKPHIPDGLPPAVENVLLGCFEYDFRSRPMMADILRVFESSKNAVYHDGNWTNIGSRTIVDKSNLNGYTEWFLSKDHLEVGDMVRSRKPLNSCKPENMLVPKGTIVGLDTDSDQNGYILVRVHGMHDPVRVHGSTLEGVTFGLAAWDWVRLKKENKKHSPVGILHSINRDGNVAVGIIGIETLWKGDYSDLQMAETYCTGQFVRLKSNVFSPRFQWLRKIGCEWATGRISLVLPNGCLVVKFPSRLTFGDANSCFLADPAEIELVSFSTS